MSQPRLVPPPAAADPPSIPRCRLCGCRLNGAPASDLDAPDDLILELCASCKPRPEARRLGLHVASDAGAPLGSHVARLSSGGPGAQAGGRSAREFTPAELSLIQRVHAYMPPAQLLALLNERLACDLGPDAAPYTLEQLQRVARPAVASSSGAASAGDAQHWPGLRQLLARARRAGILARVDAQLIDDFAVVFLLNPKQVIVLKDVVLGAKEV